MMSFPTVLRIAALLVVLAVAMRFLLANALSMIPFATVALLLLLSFSYARWPRSSAAIALLPAVLVPLFVLIGHSRGRIELPLVIFDWLVFGWLLWNAAKVLRRKELVGKTS